MPTVPSPLARLRRPERARLRRWFHMAHDFLQAAPGHSLRPGELTHQASNQPLAQAGRAQAAIKKGAIPDLAAEAATSLAPALASFCHPEAARDVLLDGHRVAYALQRSARRTIGFGVSAQGLRVSAPQRVPLAEIDRAVQSKAGWILRKLHETRARHERLDATQMVWQDGALLPFLGEPLRLALEPRQPQTALLPDAQAGAAGRVLCIPLAPASATPEQIRQAVQVWLMQQAQQMFTERLNHFSPPLGVQWRQLGLTNARTRWGSAKVGGDIRLNWRLLQFRPRVIDYVVVHELSHLRVMDHSARFWDIVRGVMPDYLALRRELKDDVIARW